MRLNAKYPARRGLTLPLLAALVAAMLLAAGCGGGDDDAGADNGTATESEVTTTAADDPVAASADIVAEMSETTGVEFPAPTEAFDPGKKRVAVIMAGQDEGFTAMYEGVAEAAEAMGWEVTPPMDGKFSPATQAGHLQQAVNQGFDAIVLLVIEAPAVEAALAAANAADIPVACVMCDNRGFEDQIMDVTTSGYPAGVAMAHFVIADSEGQAKILLFDDKGFAINGFRVQGFRETIEEHCPDCEIVDEFQITAADLGKPGPPQWLGTLTRFPEGSFDYAVFPYDYYAIPAGKSAIEQGRDVAITGYDGAPEMVSLIGEGGGVFRATVSAPFPYIGWAAMDQVARASAGLESWDTTSMPLRLVTADNAEEFPSGWYVPSDVDPKEVFTQVWETG